MSNRRALFVAEAVSLAHVARPVVLARALQSTGWNIDFAYSGNFSIAAKGISCSNHHLGSITPKTFLQRLSSGAPLYRVNELREYVKADLQLIRECLPDVIIGDFRLSLSVSARLAGVPYFAICNAHWSPWRSFRNLTIPDIPLVRWIGFSAATELFRLTWPLASRIHAAAMNSIRHEHGMLPLKGVETIYTDGDHIIYADVPDLIPCTGLPDTHHYIGPIIWSPDLEPPQWWGSLPDGPLAYITLGSTGRVDLLQMVLDACESEGVAVMAATAGRTDLPLGRKQCFVAPFLPGEQAAARADIVICNGGSASAYQALAHGRPVIGICSNMDQFLTMSHIERVGAGLSCRASTETPHGLRERIHCLIDDADFSANATKIQTSFSKYAAPELFVGIVNRCIKNTDDSPVAA